MARFAKVDVRIWDDSRVRAMTPIKPCGQGLWIRLLVSRHRSAVPGLLCVGEAALAEEFGWSIKDFREAFQEAQGQGLVKADWKARILWIPNARNYNRPESPNVIKSWRIPWDEAPECALKSEAYSVLKAFVEGMSPLFRKAFEEACAAPLPNQEQEQEQEHEQEQEQEQESPHTPPGGKLDLAVADDSDSDADQIRSVFDRYRVHHSRMFPSPTNKSKEWRLIRDRLHEGHTVETLCDAIDGYHESPFHCGVNESGAKYQSLALIMRDGSHVANGVRYHEERGKPVMSEKERRGEAAAMSWMEKMKLLKGETTGAGND